MFAHIWDELLFVVFLLYDLDALRARAHDAFEAFASCSAGPALHCFAVKSCPVDYILHYAADVCGLGFETASILEIKNALCCGAKADHIVFDRWMAALT